MKQRQDETPCKADLSGETTEAQEQKRLAVTVASIVNRLDDSLEVHQFELYLTSVVIFSQATLLNFDCSKTWRGRSNRFTLQTCSMLGRFLLDHESLLCIVFG